MEPFLLTCLQFLMFALALGAMAEGCDRRWVSGLSDWSQYRRTVCADSDVVQLVISANSFESLPAGALSNFSNLNTLSVRENNLLRTLPTGLLTGLTGLTRLEVKDNVLTSLPSAFLQNLTNLSSINFSGNRFSSLSRELFRGLTQLQSLTVAGNVLTTLPSGLLQGLPRLQDLDIRDNRIRALPAGFFSPATRLSNLSMDCPPECTLKCLRDDDKLPVDCVPVSPLLATSYYHATGTMSPTKSPSTQSPSRMPSSKRPSAIRAAGTVSPSRKPTSRSPSSQPTVPGEVFLPKNASSITVNLQDMSVNLPAELFTIFNRTQLVVNRSSTKACAEPDIGQGVGEVLLTVVITNKDTGEKVHKLPVPFTFTLPRTGLECDPSCGWYNRDTRTWEVQGCKVESSNDTALQCVCTHLTDFAVLFKGNVCDPVPMTWMYALVACYALVLAYCIAIILRQAYMRLCGLVCLQHLLVCGVAILRMCSLLRYLHVFKASDAGKAVLITGPYIFQDLILSILIESWRQAAVSTTGKVRVGLPMVVFNSLFIVIVIILAVGLGYSGSGSAWALGGTLAIGLLLVIFIFAFGAGGVLMKQHLSKSGIKGSSTLATTTALGIRFQRIGFCLSILFAIELISSVCALAWVEVQIALLALTTVYMCADILVWVVVLYGYWVAIRKQEKPRSRSDKSREINLASQREREKSLAMRKKAAAQQQQKQQQQLQLELGQLPQQQQQQLLQQQLLPQPSTSSSFAVEEMQPLIGGVRLSSPSVSEMTSLTAPVRIVMSTEEEEEKKEDGGGRESESIISKNKNNNKNNNNNNDDNSDHLLLLPPVRIIVASRGESEGRERERGRGGEREQEEQEEEEEKRRREEREESPPDTMALLAPQSPVTRDRSKTLE